MSGDTLGLFIGDFLVSPIPLEISFNYCSHKCAVCFANLNKPERVFDAATTMKTIQNAMSGGGRLVGQLLRDGYPVLASNRVDPFATSNYRQSLPVLQTLRDCGVPLSFQTRGGKGIDDILTGLPPSTWYISVNQDDDTLRQQMEPGAPSIDSRFELMERLTSLGHTVVLGLNPLVPEWFDNDSDRIVALFERGAKCGAKGLWVGWLHLNYKQIANMSEREKAAVGEPLMKRSAKRHIDREQIEIGNIISDVAKAIGIRYYIDGGDDENGGLWSLYREVNPKTFGTIFEFSDWCKTVTPEEQRSDPISFEDLKSVMLPTMPEGQFSECRDYVRIKQVVRNCGLGEPRSYEDVLRVIWQRDEFATCPAMQTDMAWLVDGENNSLVDENGLPLLVAGSPDCSRFLYAECP